MVQRKQHKRVFILISVNQLSEELPSQYISLHLELQSNSSVQRGTSAGVYLRRYIFPWTCGIFYLPCFKIIFKSVVWILGLYALQGSIGKVSANTNQMKYLIK